MKNYLKNQQFIIISFFIILFAMSSAWLFFISAKYMNPDYKTDWWAVYFENPQDQSLNFTIENHSSKNNFHWEITGGQNKLQEGDILVSKGNKKNIPVDFQTEDNKKVIIRVSTDNNEAKEIYKNL